LDFHLFSSSGSLIGTGVSAANAHYERSYRNRILDMNVSPGTYTIAVGSNPLSQADAWAKSNTGGTTWTVYDVGRQITLYNKYKLKISFQQQ
jgi:hypothetical protein